MQSLSNVYLTQGISPGAMTVMLQAQRLSTHKQYSTYITAWFTYCSTRAIRPFMPTVAQTIDFLDHLRNTRNLGYNALNTARCALSAILPSIDSNSIGRHPLVRTYMKGAFNIRPPVPRYSSTWDPDILLTFLRRWSPHTDIDLKCLTMKVVMLMLLVSGQRIQTLFLLDIAEMTVKQDSISFRILGLLKQSRPGYRNPLIVFKKYTVDSNVCVFTYLSEYLKRTKLLRTDNWLFISFKRPHHRASKDTITRWVRNVMDYAGLDTNLFRPHSVRSASVSAAKRGGAQVQDIMDKAGWSTSSTFAKFYDKTMSRPNQFAFDVAVLSSNKNLNG